MFRWFNRISTGEAIFDGTPSAFDQFLATRNAGVLLKAIKARCGGGPYVTGAYCIFGTPGMPKLDGICDRIQKFIGRYDQAPLPSGLSLEAAWNFFLKFGGIGDLMSYEITTDLRWTDMLRNAPDAMEWGNAGPGAVRGLNRLHGRPIDARLSKGQSTEMRELLSLSQSPEWWTGPAMEMREIEHSACEFDKYLRRKSRASKNQSSERKRT